MPLLKRDLLARVVRALQDSGAQVYVADGHHPFRILVRHGSDAVAARVYIWNLTHGGGPRAEGEQRIQVTGVPVPLSGLDDEQIFLLGYKEESDVFAAFDPDHHRQPSPGSPSIQITQAALDQARARGVSTHRRKNDEVAVALEPAMLAPYMRRQRVIHDELVDDDALLGELERAADPTSAEGTDESVPSQGQGLGPREEVFRTFRTLRREHSFRRRVLDGYGHRCAVCEIQLDLVQAAHIVPVEEPGSTDETRNGIALCPLHHVAYDHGVIGIASDTTVMVNDQRLADLQGKGLVGGADAFRANLRSQLLLPADVADHPEPEFLARGLEVRRWPAS